MENSSRPLEYSVIVCGVGSKYKSLCSNVVRTILINPTDRLTSAYNSLCTAFKAVVTAIRPGANFADVHRIARQTLAEHDAKVSIVVFALTLLSDWSSFSSFCSSFKLADAMEPIVGHSMGYEFFESVSLTQDAVGTFKPGMVFNLMLMLQNVEGKVGEI